MDIDRAVAIMIIPGVFLNMWLIWTYRKYAVRIKNFQLVCSAGVIGVICGSLVLTTVAPSYLLLFLAIWLGGYLLSLFFKKKLLRSNSAGRHKMVIVVAIAGLIQGAVGTAGPILAPFVHSLNLKQPQYVFVISVLFQIFALTQFISFLFLGLINVERAYESFLACVPIIIFLPLAVRLSRFFSDRGFNFIIIGLLILIEVRLIWRILSQGF